MLKKSILYLGLSAVIGSSAAIAGFEGNISPQEAFERASTEANVYILDVRTGQEWKWVGHPGPNGLADSKGKGLSFNSGAKLVDNSGTEPKNKVVNIAYWLDDGQGGFIKGDDEFIAGPDQKGPQLYFDTDVMGGFGTDDILLILCRTGGRALLAAQHLGNLGYTTYRIEHGFRGDKNDETKPGPDTLYQDVNGWVNNKLPYNGDFAGAYYPQ
jgi:rhodanese-related sulfurtransferase